MKEDEVKLPLFPPTSNANYSTITTPYLSLSRSWSFWAELEKRMIEVKDFRAIKILVAKKRMVEKYRNCRVSVEDEKSQSEVTLAVLPPVLTSSETAASTTKSSALSSAIFKMKPSLTATVNERRSMK